MLCEKWQDVYLYLLVATPFFDFPYIDGSKQLIDSLCSAGGGAPTVLLGIQL